MTHDPLEQLAQATVPPLPADFDRAVHQRLNRTLVVGQLTEFACLALPCALAEFARALAAAALYTSSGKYPAAEEREPRTEQQP
ncbi:MAG TPA: hypothetical protein VG826_16650 [Pirellulales bacterium]|nr:hypothetical protein [Pirellulales bacterium]